jgi:hypothetical protein
VLLEELFFQSLKVKGIANAIKKTNMIVRECLKRVLTNLKVNPKPDMITILGCYRFVNLRLILKMSDFILK